MSDFTEDDVNWHNRHIMPIPDTAAIIKIKAKHSIEICSWHPYDPKNYHKNNQPDKGYLGSAKVIEGGWKGISFNVWQQNDSEFVQYKILSHHKIKLTTPDKGSVELHGNKYIVEKLTQSNMKNEEKIEEFSLPNGINALNLMPPSKRQGAIVDLEVLKKLAAHLHGASLEVIKKEFMRNIQENAVDINSYVNVIEDELAFQRTVNLISTIQVD